MKWRGFGSGAVLGLLLWLASDYVFGRAEPWQRDIAYGYVLVLGIAGYVHVDMFKNGIAAAYLSIYAGQLFFFVLQLLTGEGNRHPVDAVVLLAWTLPVLAGAQCAQWKIIRAARRQAKDKPPS